MWCFFALLLSSLSAASCDAFPLCKLPFCQQLCFASVLASHLPSVLSVAAGKARICAATETGSEKWDPVCHIRVRSSDLRVSFSRLFAAVLSPRIVGDSAPPPRIQAKKPQFQHILDQECSFLSLISGCTQPETQPVTLPAMAQPSTLPFRNSTLEPF